MAYFTLFCALCSKKNGEILLDKHFNWAYTCSAMKKNTTPTITKIDVDKKSGEPIIVKVSEKELSKSCQSESKTQTPEKRKKSKGKQLEIAKAIGFVTDKNTDRKTRILKNLITFLFFAFAIGVLVYTAINDFAGKPVDWSVIKATLTKNWQYLVLAVFAVIFFFIAKGTQRSVLCKSITGKWHYKSSIKAGIVCQVYNNITPLAVGGQPFEINHFTKNGISGGESTSIVISAYIANMFTVVFLGILAVVSFRFNLLGHPNLAYIPSTIFVLAIIGLCANLAMPALVIMFCISPRLCSKLVYFVIWLGEKFKIVKNPTATRYKTLKSVLVNSRGIKKLFKRPLVLLATIFLSALELFAMATVAYFTLRFYGFGGGNGWANGGIVLWLQIMELCLLINNAVAIVPTPGNAGAADLSFYAIFSFELAQGLAFPAMLTWRLLTFYLIIVVGFILVRIFAKKDKKRAALLENK